MTIGRRLLPAAILASAITLTACDGPQSTLVPAGRDAERIAQLFAVIASGALIIWVAVVGIAIYSIRSRRGRHSQRAATLFIIGGGVALPVVVLAAVLAYGLRLLPEILTPGPEAGLHVEVTAKQWWWRVRYLTERGP